MCQTEHTHLLYCAPRTSAYKNKGLSLFNQEMTETNPLTLAVPQIFSLSSRSHSFFADFCLKFLSHRPTIKVSILTLTLSPSPLDFRCFPRQPYYKDLLFGQMFLGRLRRPKKSSLKEKFIISAKLKKKITSDSSNIQ